MVHKRHFEPWTITGLNLSWNIPVILALMVLTATPTRAGLLDSIARVPVLAGAVGFLDTVNEGINIPAYEIIGKAGKGEVSPEEVNDIFNRQVPDTMALALWRATPILGRIDIDILPIKEKERLKAIKERIVSRIERWKKDINDLRTIAIHKEVKPFFKKVGIHDSSPTSSAISSRQAESLTKSDDEQAQELYSLTAVEPVGPPGIAEQAQALRKLAVERADVAVRVFGLIPGVSWLLPQDASEAERNNMLKQVWGVFFENAIVETLAVETATPAVLYYNPLLDIALLTRWERATDLSHQISGLWVMPGERLSAKNSTVPAAPGWMASATPIETLYNTTGERLSAFRNDRAPANEGAADQNHQQAVRDLRLAQPRLEWNLLQRAEWHDTAHGWLAGTIAAIEETLLLNDATALLTRAVDTEVETATILANLPEGLVESLTLDMVLNYEDEDRLLVISLPDDGHVYIMVQCRLLPDAGLCLPRKYFLVGFGMDDDEDIHEST